MPHPVSSAAGDGGDEYATPPSNQKRPKVDVATFSSAAPPPGMGLDAMAAAAARAHQHAHSSPAAASAYHHSSPMSPHMAHAAAHRYPPQAYPYPYSPYTHHQQQPPPPPPPPAAAAQTWACDHCKTATFTSFEDTQAHENVCNYNPNKTSAVVSPPHPATNARTIGVSASADMQMPPLNLGYPHPHTMMSSTPVTEATNALANMATRTPQRTQMSSSYEQSDDEGVAAGQMGDSDEDGRVVFRLYRDADTASLSDRQCYVRQHFVQVFTATDNEVSMRHTKGAQRLSIGQVGIRCVFCQHLDHKERAERAVCYPSSVSRIYQTVADMQRFHFEACSSIPTKMKLAYRTLKTTRPRGMGSPQQYWIESAYDLGLVDTDKGIRYDASRVVAPPDDADNLKVQSAIASEDKALEKRKGEGYHSPPSPTHSSSSHASSPMSAILEAAEIAREGRDQPPPRSNSKRGASEISTHGDEHAAMLLSLRNSPPTGSHGRGSPPSRPDPTQTAAV